MGAALVEELALAAPNSSVVAIDIEPATSSFSSVISLKFDLNPLNYVGGFHVWSRELHALLESMTEGSTTQVPVPGVFLGVARYHVGRYELSSTTDRANILGPNILGKWEVLHAVMRVNAIRGFDNAEVLGIFDVGSLHSLRHTSHRALYNPTKAASLAMCKVLSSGSEVRRAIHLAPGCVDTPMLHWNHWFLKEQGDPELPDLVRRKLPLLYRSIFREGDVQALANALSELGIEDPSISIIFDRYLNRRKMVAETEEGLTSPESLAQYIASIMLQESSDESGIVEVTSPRGSLRFLRIPF